MTAKIWISIIAGVLIAGASIVGVLYSPWFIATVAVGALLVLLGSSSLSQVSVIRNKREGDSPVRIFRSSAVDSILAGTDYCVIMCSNAQRVRIALIYKGFPYMPAKDDYGHLAWTSFNLPEVDARFSMAVATRLEGSVRELLNRVVDPHNRGPRAEAFDAWVEISQRGQ